MTSHPWSRIPAELRERPQWLVAGPTKAPLGIDSKGNTYNGSVTDPNTWCSFPVAAQYAHEHGLHIGYVISANDPFCCIDLDWTDAESQARKGKAVDPSTWSTPADAQRYALIVDTYASYTERSTYGKGLHIWVRADIGTGSRRDGVEVYSQDRFIICTGDRLDTNANIEDRQQLITLMVSDMRNGATARNKLEPLVELPEGDEWDQLESDGELFRKAGAADNGDKFNALCEGNYEQYGFPSQSEADLALMSMFTFYSDINSQCRRCFRKTALGKREKAVKNDRYVNYTIQLIRHRQKFDDTSLQDITKANNNYESLISEANNKQIQAEQTPLTGAGGTVQPKPVPAAVALATLTTPAPSGKELPYPPGFAGAVADFIYNSSPRPVREVAIVAALGLLAGICGKAWHIPQSGLNLYIVLVARSGIGKETMHSGISCILKACTDPVVQTFVSFSDFASGPALVKYCVENNSFINVSGEWGRKLKRIAEDAGDGPIATLRTMMTNLYQKSGPQSILGGIEYSNQENKVQSVSGVAYSMIGETTPDTFYQALTETMMEDGFLSRFTIIEYTGDRPMANKKQVLTPNQQIVNHITGMASLAASINGQTAVLNSKRQSVLVGRTDEGRDILDAFELECDDNIRGSTDEGWRQMWNRGALKAMRIAALLGVADNPSFPVVEKQHAEWAVDVVRRDIGIMRKKISEGDVGMGDHNRQRKLVSVVRDYLTGPCPAGYKVGEKMHGDRVIPLSYLSTRTARLAVFQKHKLGAANALTSAIREMIEQGYFHEIPTAKTQTDYGTRGKCYMVVDLPLVDSKKG